VWVPVVSLILAVAMAVPPAGAQTPDAPADRYAAIVETYRAGDDRAVADIRTWMPADIDGVLGSAAARGGRFAAAAAMLHTEAAIAASGMNRAAEGAAQLAAAAALVQSLPADAAAFIERYYGFAPTLFFARGDLDGARPWVERGLQLFQYSAPVNTAAGMLDELTAHVGDPECVGRECAAGGATTLAGSRLAAAGREYRIALERDPSYEEARLHLGRVLAMQGQDMEADAALAAVIESGSPRGRYLAHLFRGDLAANRDDRTAARREYEAAMTESPECQTPYLALAHLEDAAGNAVRARQLIAQWAQREADVSADPWWTYQNGGIDRNALQWLIDYARR
jgi:hypothetical protein